MATKKAASQSKKTTTKVTTIKAVESHPAMEAPVVSKKAVKFSLSSTPLVAALIAEFIGTFVFAATILAGQGQPILVFFALVGVVLAVGTISGGYVNPALVIGAWVTRRMSGLRALAYIAAQVLGAMLALVVLSAYVSSAPDVSQQATAMGQTAPKLFEAALIPQGKEWLLFLSEFVGTLVFGFAVAGATREKKDRTAAALTVGLGVFLGLMIAGSAAAYIGGSAILNPAVAFSLHAISDFKMWPIVVYIIGASLGSIVGFLLYDLLRGAEKDQA